MDMNFMTKQELAQAMSGKSPDEVVADLKVGGHELGWNYAMPKELTVEITLAEYRKLIVEREKISTLFVKECRKNEELEAEVKRLKGEEA